MKPLPVTERLTKNQRRAVVWTNVRPDEESEVRP